MPSPGVASTWGATDYAKFVLDHLAAEAITFASGVVPIPIAGKECTVPRLLNDGTAEWTAEGAEIASSAPDADTITLAPKALKNVVSLSNESIGDTPVAVLDRVGAALTRAVATKLDTTLFDAVVASAIRPAGLRSAAYTLPGAVAATIGDAASLDLFLDGQTAIQNAGGKASAVYISGTDAGEFAKLKDEAGSNRPLLERDSNGRLIYQGLTFYVVPGLPVDTAIVADSRQLVVGVRQDISVSFSEHQKFSADSVVARVVARFDWEPADLAGFYHLT